MHRKKSLKDSFSLSLLFTLLLSPSLKYVQQKQRILQSHLTLRQMDLL